jgi:hypothetical protein
MPDDALDRVLRLVAEGRLTADEAGPILDALDDKSRAAEAGPDRIADRPIDGPARALRIEVSESGRKVINLRVPLALGRAAISQIPGITEATSDRIREAIESGLKGSIVEVDEDDGGVRISIE